jgi:hypothetical protein
MGNFSKKNLNMGKYEEREIRMVVMLLDGFGINKKQFEQIEIRIGASKKKRKEIKGEIGTVVVVLNGFGIEEIIGQNRRNQNRGSHRKREKSRWMRQLGTNRRRICISIYLYLLSSHSKRVNFFEGLFFYNNHSI